MEVDGRNGREGGNHKWRESSLFVSSDGLCLYGDRLFKDGENSGSWEESDYKSDVMIELTVFSKLKVIKSATFEVSKVVE